MTNLINAIYKSLDEKNYYAALFMALTIPDICGKLEYPDLEQKSKVRYCKWVEDNLFKYYRIICFADVVNQLNSEDFYNIRCGVLHAGETTNQKNNMNMIVFTTTDSHLNYGEIDGKRYLQFNVEQLCRDILFALSLSKLDKKISLPLRIETERWSMGDGLFENCE